MIYSCEKIPLKEIIVDRKFLSRKTPVEQIIKDESFAELKASIKKVGQLQPVGIYPIAYKKYKLLFGLRRFLACNELGWKNIIATIHL